MRREGVQVVRQAVGAGPRAYVLVTIGRKETRRCVAVAIDHALRSHLLGRSNEALFL